MPFFSVVIPTYDRLPYLQQALQSVWTQTFKDYEVIVVDDGSTDGTWEYLQSLGQKLRVLRQENLGPAIRHGPSRSEASQVDGAVCKTA